MRKLLFSLLFASPAFSFAQQVVSQAPPPPQLHMKAGKALRTTGVVFISSGFLVMAIGAVSNIHPGNFSITGNNTSNGSTKPANNSSSTIVGIGAAMVGVGFPMYFIGRSKMKKVSMAIQQQPPGTTTFRMPGKQTQFSLAYHF